MGICDGRVVIVTGAGSGIGKGIAQVFGKHGAKVLVVARTDAAVDALVSQFQDHSARRIYEAVVWGIPEAPHGIIDAPIGRDPKQRKKMSVIVPGSPRARSARARSAIGARRRARACRR